MSLVSRAGRPPASSVEQKVTPSTSRLRLKATSRAPRTASSVRRTNSLERLLATPPKRLLVRFNLPLG